MLDKTEGGDYDPDSIKDLRDPRVMLPMASLDIMVKDLKWVNSVDSPTNSIRRYNNGRIPRNAEEIKNILEQNPDAKSHFNDDYSIARLVPRADFIDRPEFYELMEEIEGVNFPKEVAIVPQGPVPDDIEFEQTMGADTMKTALIGFILIIFNDAFDCVISKHFRIIDIIKIIFDPF